jgi:dGTPase
MRAGLIRSEQLKNVEIFTEAQSRINAMAIKDPTVQKTRTAKTIIDILVTDCIDASKKTIDGINPKTVDQVYQYSKNLITLSNENNSKLAALEKFLVENFYQHKSVTQTAKQIEDWLQQLFEKFCHKQELMPGYFQQFISREGLQRTVCDYIAGMTDRFCLKMLKKTGRYLSIIFDLI